jgi:type I restriction enzyme R subunit
MKQKSVTPKSFKTVVTGRSVFLSCQTVTMGAGGLTEADTCREYVRPAIAAAGWSDREIREQYPVLNDLPEGRGGGLKRRADYVLELDGVPLIVIEAKRAWAKPDDGLQQAIRYASKLGAPLAVSTNGRGWTVHSMQTGALINADELPSPEVAWGLLVQEENLGPDAQAVYRAPFNRTLISAGGDVKTLRYYQVRAVNAIIRAMYAGDKRILTVMATGSGKTFTALQLVWKLWRYRTRPGAVTSGRFRVLYLADRDELVRTPMDKYFSQVFEQGAVSRVSSRDTRMSPDIYFATYQGMLVAGTTDDTDVDSGEISLLAGYPEDYFDLIIVDECHRGSSRADSAWRGILDHFAAATQLGLTATPRDDRGIDTFDYFGNPVFTYSLADGISDGYLAPYTIRRVVLDVDADGYEVLEGQRDDFGNEIPDGVYATRDFERSLSLPQRTHAMAQRTLELIGRTRRRAVVFCVDQKHAADMAQELRNLDPDRTARNPEWAVRITSDEREKRRLLGSFTDTEEDIPQIATTASLLSTGVDVEDLFFVVLARPIGSIPEFKQIIGRGTRLFPEKDKFEFEIVDFVGATAKFLDPGFDGPPLKVIRELADGRSTDFDEPATFDAGVTDNDTEDWAPEVDTAGRIESNANSHIPEEAGRQAFDGYVLSRATVTFASEGVYVHDTSTGRPRLVTYIDWIRGQVLSRFARADDLLNAWADPEQRSQIARFLAGRGIDLDRLAELSGNHDTTPVDSVDQLIQLAWNTPKMTRSERASVARDRHRNDIETYPPAAREVLLMLLDRYAEAGIEEISSVHVLEVPPLADLGDRLDIARRFGDARAWHSARATVQRWIYGT